MQHVLYRQRETAFINNHYSGIVFIYVEMTFITYDDIDGAQTFFLLLLFVTQSNTLDLLLYVSLDNIRSSGHQT